MKKSFKIKSTLSFDTSHNSIDLLYDDTVFSIEEVAKVSESFGPHITTFFGTVNGEACSVIVNCGLTPPTIKFQFSQREEVLPINHSFQDEILEEINNLIRLSSLVSLTDSEY